jgi:Tol biopolymer transport system component
MKNIILIMIFCLGPMIMVSGQEQQAQKLLSEAIYQEEVKGDLDNAIKTYQLILSKYPDNRKISAEVLLHLGMCYEKLGNQEAIKTYKRLVNNFPEQKNQVAVARERLSKLEKPDIKTGEPEGIRIKQIWKEPLLDDLGTVSYDGRFRSYVDWGEGDVAIQDLITGEKKKLTNKASVGGDTEYFADGTAISKNGKLIASSWCKPYNTTDLIIVDVENLSMNNIYSQLGEEVYPAAWLSDKQLVATRYFPERNIIQIVSFKIPDKTPKIIKSFEKWQNLQLACSPDEKYIAYNFANDADNGNSDINLLSAEGDKDIPLIRHPANDKVLGWVPGRKEFLFISDRSGTWDLWAIKLDDGKPTGLPERIYADIGDVSPVGFTQNGKCYFGFVRRNFNSYIAPFNPEKGAIELGSGKSIKGSNFGLTWSPDGQHLVYMNLDNERRNIARLVVRDLKTDKEQDPSNNYLTPWQFKWSPDGNSILVMGRENSKDRSEGYKGGVFKVNVKTGQTDKIFLLTDYKYNIPEDDSSPLSYLVWSKDGRSFYYLFYKDRLVKHNIETGEDMILYQNSDFTPYVLALSPDGKNLLFGLEYPGDHKSHLFTIPAEGGKEKAVCTAQESKSIGRVIYSPDGKYIYFVELPEGTKTCLWRVPAEGGNPEKVWSSDNTVQIYDIHPDGNQVALSIYERSSELRVIENLVQELEKLEKSPK